MKPCSADSVRSRQLDEMLPKGVHYAIREMPITWKGHDPLRPWPKLEGKDAHEYRIHRLSMERQQREFIQTRRHLCQIAYLATGLVIPINTNLKDYMLSTSNGIITHPKQAISEFGVGAKNELAVATFYHMFWRRIRLLDRLSRENVQFWTPGRPVAVNGIRSAHVGEGYWFSVGQYNEKDKISTSPEWHKWYQKWGEMAVIKQ